MSNVSLCDRCSCELDEEDDVCDGPEGTEWEGCVLCAVCLQLVEESDE